MRKIRKTKTQKLWMQKGCSHKHHKNCDCVCHHKGGKKGKSRSMKGGNCSACGSAALFQNGGMPPARIGNPWTPAIGTWPGVQGIQGVTNYLAYNKYHVDPQTAMKVNDDGYVYGGKKMTKKRGGGIFPQDLVNFGSTLTYGLNSAYNSLAGVPQPVNPLPYNDQLPNTARANQLIY